MNSTYDAKTVHYKWHWAGDHYDCSYLCPWSEKPAKEKQK